MSEYTILDSLFGQDMSANPFARLGECIIDQRNPTGAAHTVVAAAAAAYTLDGWLAACTGANVTVQQVAGSGEFQKVLRVTGALGNTGVTLTIRAEDTDVAQFANIVSTMAAWLSSSTAKTVTWVASYANAVNNFAAVTQIGTGSFITGTTLQKHWFRIPASASIGNGLQVTFSVPTLVAGETLDITGLDLCELNVVRPYPHISEGEVLAKCQRYLPAFNAAGTHDVICTGMFNITSGGFIYYRYSTPPFRVPTGITTSALNGFSLGEPGITASVVTVLSFVTSSQLMCELTSIGTGAPYTVGYTALLYSTSATAQILFTGAEL